MINLGLITICRKVLKKVIWQLTIRIVAGFATLLFYCKDWKLWLFKLNEVDFLFFLVQQVLYLYFFFYSFFFALFYGMVTLLEILSFFFRSFFFCIGYSLLSFCIFYHLVILILLAFGDCFGKLKSFKFFSEFGGGN